MAGRSRIGSLADVLPVALVEPDGLIITTDGRYVRLIECDRVPNTITADPADLSRIGDAFTQLCRIIPDRQSLMILAQTDPVAIDDALDPDEQATHTAAEQDRRDGNLQLAARAGAAVRGDPADGDRRRRRRAAGGAGALVGRGSLHADDRRQPRAAARARRRRARPDVVGDPPRGRDREPAA